MADRTLSARYDVLFEGIFATMQTTYVPEFFMRRFVAPPIRVDRAGRALAAPLGLRRVESALLAQTPLTGDDVVCTTPEALGRLLGPWVKAVGVSSSDPLGRGMSNTTTTAFWSGELYTKVWNRRLMAQLNQAKRQYGFRVVFGGAGAWQYLQDPPAAAEAGIDTIFEGYFESGGAAVFADLVNGRSAPGHVRAAGTGGELVRPIRGASAMGMIELSRGCGNGCGFCLMAGVKMSHLPRELILADVAANVAGGMRSAVSSSEDFFRYGGRDGQVNFEALAGLLEELRRVRGLAFLQLDHGNISSVLQFSDEQLRHIRRLLDLPGRSEYLWVNLGAESANGQLVAANGPGKLGGFRPEDWEQMVLDSADKLTRCGFFPVFSFILGLPGETPDDVANTERLVGRLAEGRAATFPIFYEPVRPGGRGAFNLTSMRPDHLRLYRRCYEVNFRQVPRLYWDNQRAGGVGWAKRTLVQMLGKVQTRCWRRNFARVGRRLEEATPPGRAGQRAGAAPGV